LRGHHPTPHPSGAAATSASEELARPEVPFVRTGSDHQRTSWMVGAATA
jgi:hypothetical protein